MNSHNQFVFAAQGFDTPSLEMQYSPNTASRGKTQVVAAAKGINQGQQTRHVADDIEPVPSLAEASFVLFNQSPSRFQERLRKCFDQPSPPAKAISLNKSLFGQRPSRAERQRVSGGNACEPIRDSVGPRKPRSPQFGAPRAKGPSQQKALVIGIDGTLTSKDPLDFAASDANRFKACLEDQLGFNAANVLLLTDEDGRSVSQRDILNDLQWLFRGAGSGDLLVLFISGHCSLEAKNGVVALESAEQRGQRSIPSTVFKSLIDKLPKDCTVEIVLDCCYSGGLIKVPYVVEEMVSNSESCINLCYTSISPIISPIISPAISPTSSTTSSPSSTPPTSPEPSPTSSPICPPASSPASGYPETRIFYDRPTIASYPPFQSSSAPLGDYEVKERTSHIGPRPKEHISTAADVTVWAACRGNEQAYESAAPAGYGILTNAICSVIESLGALAGRRRIWDQIKKEISAENAQEPKHVQHPQILSSRDDRKRIMDAPAFQKQGS